MPRALPAEWEIDPNAGLCARSSERVERLCALGRAFCVRRRTDLSEQLEADCRSGLNPIVSARRIRLKWFGRSSCAVLGPPLPFGVVAGWDEVAATLHARDRVANCVRGWPRLVGPRAEELGSRYDEESEF